MNMSRSNPYKNKGKYRLLGNLHTHTDRSGCGKVRPKRVLELFEKAGFSFLSITDHWIISEPKEFKTKLIILSGVEADIKGAHHKCVINTDNKKVVYNKALPHQKLIDRNIKNGAVVTLNHPDWEPREHYTIEELRSYKNYTGIEIYNTVIERLDGSPLSTAKWDRLLSSGHPCFGFASQDFHIESDLSGVGIIVMTARKTAKDILAAIKTGNFYAFNGVYISDISRNKNTISVKTKNAGLIKFIGFGGTTLKKVAGKKAEITFEMKDPRHQYIRVECIGSAGKVSWTQPFYR